MPHQIRLPETYVFARASVSHGGRWTAEVLRACHQVAIDSGSIEIVDEQQTTDAGDLAGVVLKISARLSLETLLRLSDEIKANCPQGVSAQLVKGVPPAEFVLDPEDLSIEYFRREFAVDSNMIRHTDSCAKLTHRPTGGSARSTVHRSRALNYEEALFLLEALLRSDAHLA